MIDGIEGANAMLELKFCKVFFFFLGNCLSQHKVARKNHTYQGKEDERGVDFENQERLEQRMCHGYSGGSICPAQR